MSEGPAPGLRAWAGIAGAAVVAAAMIPSGPPGIGLLIAGCAIAGAVAAARPRRLDADSLAFSAAALAFLAMAAIFDAPWVILVDVLAAAACSAIAVTGAQTWTAVLTAPFRVAAQAFNVPGVMLRALPRGRFGIERGAAARALGLSTVLLVTFGALFTSADAAFARIAEDVLLPDIGAELLPARVLTGLLVLAGAGALVLTGLRPSPVTGEKSRFSIDPFAPSSVRRDRGPRALSTIEWALPLALLNALFAAFVVVQIAVLFGGHRQVLETSGLTYAEYARAGFFQLVVIAALVLGVVAASVKVVKEHRRLLKVLLGVLCVLTLVVLASALRRMDLYESAYGLTRIRVAVYAVDLWLAGLFTLVVVAGAANRASWLPRAVVALTVAGLLAFNVSNPDARIAESGVERWRATGEIDAYYLSTLSADGLPPLMGLPHDVRRCIVGPIAAGVQRSAGAWSSFNLSRERSLDLTATEDITCTY